MKDPFAVSLCESAAESLNSSRLLRVLFCVFILTSLFSHFVKFAFAKVSRIKLATSLSCFLLWYRRVECDMGPLLCNFTWLLHWRVTCSVTQIKCLYLDLLYIYVLTDSSLLVQTFHHLHACCLSFVGGKKSRRWGRAPNRCLGYSQGHVHQHWSKQWQNELVTRWQKVSFNLIDWLLLPLVINALHIKKKKPWEKSACSFSFVLPCLCFTCVTMCLYSSAYSKELNK